MDYLFGSSNAHIQTRKLILEHCDLQAVISMPTGVFQPYSGVGTSVIIFIKGGKTENVWFYEMDMDGYTLDVKRDFIDGKGDIPEIIEYFEHNTISKNSFVVNIEDISNKNYNLSPTSYKKFEYFEVEFENPDELINDIINKQQLILSEMKKLKDMV